MRVHGFLDQNALFELMRRKIIHLAIGAFYPSAEHQLRTVGGRFTKPRLSARDFDGGPVHAGSSRGAANPRLRWDRNCQGVAG
jgi:hypothetical protein